MLAAAHRLRRSADFADVLRRGRRAGGAGLVVVHVRSAADATSANRFGPAPVRCGLVVSKAVGNSVVRHRVSRRLRALLAARTAALPDGLDVVVRASPQAATATSAQLGMAIDRALAKLGLQRAPATAVPRRASRAAS